jgi:CubicO group peptidase (beta-lactamase class C family)
VVRRPGPLLVVLALVVGFAGGAGAAFAISRATTSASSTEVSGSGAAAATHAAPARPDPWRAPLRRALERGRQQGEALGGWIDAAVWAQPWANPVVIGGGHTFRLWSVSKPITAIAIIRAARRDHRSVGPGVTQSMVDALTRSDNCAQRRDVVALQRLSGGPARASRAFRQVLGVAGASTHGSSKAKPLKYVALCASYLAAHADGLSPEQTRAPALLLGTDTWTVEDAVRFGYALGHGRYGAAGRRVLRWMREPKQHPNEGTSRDYTSPLDLPPSGGRFPASWKPAYKGGWGGHQHNNFLAEQVVILDVAGRTVAIAAVFRPDEQPINDNPGGTAAPRALEDVFAAARRELSRLSAHAGHAERP